VKLHGNARSCPASRRLMCERVVEDGWTVQEAAEAAGLSQRCAYRWLGRWRAGDRELADRSSAPRRIANRTSKDRQDTIERLRRLRMTSTRIAAELKMAVSTVGAVLARLGLHRLSCLEPLEPPNRYCRRHAGELIHVDVKKLGRFSRPGHRVTGTRKGSRNRGAGWECVHVAVDDCTRLAYVEVLADERGVTTVGFYDRALAWFARHGVTVERIMSDNGPNYRSKVVAAFCAEREIRQVFTRPYRPRTNGKAERFIQTMLREWAYAAAYANSTQRQRALAGWIDYYNQQRPHSALGHRTPASRLTAA
jgi:transposase InsO family protein